MLLATALSSLFSSALAWTGDTGRSGGGAALRTVAPAAASSGQGAPAPTTPGKSVLIRRVRRISTPDYSRVIIDIDGQPQYRHSFVPNPDRVFFDVANARVAPDLSRTPFDAPDAFLKHVRIGRNQPETVRIVLDFDGPRNYSIFELHDPFRILVDVQNPTSGAVRSRELERGDVRAEDLDPGASAASTPSRASSAGSPPKPAAVAPALVPAAAAPASEPAAPAPPELELPMSPTERAEKDGTALRISLRDLTKRALQNNLDIAIADTNEVVVQNRLIETNLPYQPSLSFTLYAQQSKLPNTNQATASSGTNFNKTDLALWNIRFAQNLRTGANLTVDYNSNRQDTNQTFALFSPQYSARSLITFSQPLRQNRQIDLNRSAIKLANLDIKINDTDFKKKVVDTIAKIQAQYWDLVSAIRDYDIQRESVKLARITLENNKKKVEIGTLAPIGITEARADMASREVDLIKAEQTIYTAENALRSLISNDRNADIWQKTIIPTDSPQLQEVKVPLNQAIDTALANRPELERNTLTLQKKDIDLEVDRNATKWQFDLVGQFGTTGIGGPQTFDSAGNPRVSPDFVGGLGNAYGTLFGQGLTFWQAGFQIKIPLRDTALQAQIAEDRMLRRQAIMDRKNTEQTVIVEVRNAVQALETNKKGVEQARLARELAEEQLEGETKRFAAGLSENFLVLDRQRALSAARGVELRSLITYKKSVIDLQKAMYTLLESNDFTIAKTSAESVPNLFK